MRCTLAQGLQSLNHWQAACRDQLRAERSAAVQAGGSAAASPRCRASRSLAGRRSQRARRRMCTRVRAPHVSGQTRRGSTASGSSSWASLLTRSWATSWWPPCSTWTPRTRSPSSCTSTALAATCAHRAGAAADSAQAVHGPPLLDHTLLAGRCKRPWPRAVHAARASGCAVTSGTGRPVRWRC